MTLSARPKTVEPGEWLAHQAAEHYRNVWNFVRIVHEAEDGRRPICNPSTCPVMSAGQGHAYNWLNIDQEPVDLPASEYMALMQRWISGKLDDAAVFPTDPSSVASSSPPEDSTNARLSQPNTDEWLGIRSGFPEKFEATAQVIFRQIFRFYAHLYWNHFIEPFYHLNLEKQLNSCFSHFILTATALNMLEPDDLRPMQYLVDLWAADGTFPSESRAYSFANVGRGKYLRELAVPRSD